MPGHLWTVSAPRLVLLPVPGSPFGTVGWPRVRWVKGRGFWLPAASPACSCRNATVSARGARSIGPPLLHDLPAHPANLSRILRTPAKAVAVSGRRLVVVLISLLVCAPGCTPPHHRDRLALPILRPAATPPAQSTSAPAEFCRVELPATWRSALATGHLTHQPGEALVVQAIGPDGRSVFGDSYVNGVRSVVWLRDGGRQRTVVMRFRDDTFQLSGVDFDGRWLVFSVWDQPILDTAWTMYAWDSATGGPVRTLRRSTVPGPYAYPVVISGKAFWAQAVNSQHS